MGWFKWLEDFFYTKHDTSSQNSRKELMSTDKNLALMGLALRSAASCVATNTATLASVTYRHISEIDYAFYTDRTYVSVVQASDFLYRSVYNATGYVAKLYKDRGSHADPRSRTDPRFQADHGSRADIRSQTDNGSRADPRSSAEDQELKQSTTEMPHLRLEKVDKEEFSKDFDLICSICLDREKNRALFPCGHTYCNICTNSFTDCPICRSTINGTMKIYL